MKKLSRKSLPHNIISINHDNIKINGTFEEWIKSIAKEIKRLLAVKSKEPDEDQFNFKYIIKIESSDWSPEQNGSMPAFMIIISLGGHYLETYFSFAEIEWDRNHKNPKRLQKIFDVRFMNCIRSLHNAVREQVILLKRLGIDCSKSFPN